MSTSLATKSSRTDVVKMVVTIGLPLAIMLIPVNELFTMQLKLYVRGQRI